MLSTSINKYCYINVRYLPPFFDYKYRIRYTSREESNTPDEIKHPSVRECLNFMDLGNRGVEIQHNADLPAMSGLGSSSAFTVGLLNALYALKGKMTTKGNNVRRFLLPLAKQLISAKKTQGGAFSPVSAKS